MLNKEAIQKVKELLTFKFENPKPTAPVKPFSTSVKMNGDTTKRRSVSL